MVVVIGCWWISLLLLHRRHVPRVDGMIPTRDELLAILYRGCHPATTTGRDNEETVPPGNGIKSNTEMDATTPAETIVTMDVVIGAVMATNGSQKTTMGMVVVVVVVVVVTTMVQAVMTIRIIRNLVVVKSGSGDAYVGGCYHSTTRPDF
jgi:hypothetical protein